MSVGCFLILQELLTAWIVTHRYLHCIDKSKIYPRTGREGPEGRGVRNIAVTLPLTSALDPDGCSTRCPGSFTPVKESRYPLYRRPAGPRAGLDGCGKSCFHGIWSPDRPACSESLYRLRDTGHYQHCICVECKVKLNSGLNRTYNRKH